MPASRIAFALGDLKSEIDSLRQHQIGEVVELVLDQDTFNLVVGELEHHRGAKLQRFPSREDGMLEMVRFGGVMIECIKPTPVDHGAVSQSAAATGAV